MIHQRALVHIGVHKTGTTAFQDALMSREVELGGHGITIRCQSTALNELVVRAELDTYWRRWSPFTVLPSFHRHAKESLRKLVDSPAQTVLISDEGLSLARSPEEFQRLKDILAPRITEVVVVLRDPTAYLRSLKKELSQHWPTTGRWHDSFMYLEQDSWLARFDDLICPLKAVFGEEGVTVLSYEQELSSHGSVIPGIWRAFSLPSDLLSGVEQMSSNRSLGRFDPDENYSSIRALDDLQVLRLGWIEALEDARLAHEREVASRRLPVPRLKGSQAWAATSSTRRMLKRLLPTTGDSRNPPVQYRSDIDD